MHIGVPKEIKKHEYRVGLVPTSVQELINRGHKVFVETGAGEGIGYSDEAYEKVGAKILKNPKEVFEHAELIVKVKEPQSSEFSLIKKDQIIFTYLHLAAEPHVTKALIDSKCVAIAYETVTSDTGGLPLLSPMSEVAGRMAVQVGAFYLEKQQGGSGVLLGGVPGVCPAKVVILGAGVSGSNALKVAVGMGASVTVVDRSIDKLRALDAYYGPKITTAFSTSALIEEFVSEADLVVGAILIPGAAASKVVTKEMIKGMRPGSVLVDISIDQGGCFETSRPTTHDNPIYQEYGVTHYCVTNMPGAVARTSVHALNNATLPHIIHIAEHGYKKALKQDKHLLAGLNVYHGHITYKAVADVFGYPYVMALDAIQK